MYHSAPWYNWYSRFATLAGAPSQIAPSDRDHLVRIRQPAEQRGYRFANSPLLRASDASIEKMTTSVSSTIPSAFEPARLRPSRHLVTAPSPVRATYSSKRPLASRSRSYRLVSGNGGNQDSRRTIQLS